MGDEMKTDAFTQGLLEGDFFFHSLAKRPPRDYDELLVQVENI